MDGDGDNKKKGWLAIEVDDEALTATWRTASEIGVHATELARQFLDEGLVRYAKEKKDAGEDVHPTIEMRRLQIESRERRSRLTLCKQLAYELAEDPDNELISEALISACRIAGIDPATVNQEVSQLTHVQELMKEQGTLNQAELWLAENMEPGQKYAMKKLVAAAAMHGISEPRLKRAKAAIGAESVRVANQWAWWIPVDDGNNAGSDDEDGRIPLKGSVLH